MNTFATDLYRDLTCAAAAAAITFVVGLSFVVSTAVPMTARTPAAHILALQSDHAFFGQPEPAVLVD